MSGAFSVHTTGQAALPVELLFENDTTAKKGSTLRQITKQQIQAARRELLPPDSVATQEACVEAVLRLGFVWAFTPGTDLLPALFPALRTETEGQKWDLMWPWKDRIAASRQAFYGKVVGGKPTFVSPEWLALFYALTGNTGDLEDDLVHLAESLRLQELAIKVCHYVRENGPTGTRTLQAQLTDGSRPMKSALEKAIDQLDNAMLIVKCGTEGGNSIANVWDLFPRFWPETVDQGTEIPTREAAVRLMRQFFLLTPAITEKELPRLFHWNEKHQRNAIARLREAGELEPCELEGKAGLCRAGFAAVTE